MTRIVIPLVLASGALGAPECKSCHASEVARHQETRHSFAARPVQQTAFFRNLPDAPIAEARGGFLLSYSAEGTSVRVTARRGSEQASALIGWVLGAGDQGETPIAMSASAVLEHRISYYPRTGRYDLTLGHAPGPSFSPDAALGVRQKPEVARSCFGCHATMSGSNEVVEPGVTCERCHEGAAAHARLDGVGDVANAAKMDAAASIRVCAQCHRLNAPGHADDPLNIRFQPLRLVKSQCFRRGGLTCVSCHEAHRNAVRNDPAYYTAKCRSCHTQPHRSDNCMPCHMPRSSPAPYLEFTDHYIRKRAGRAR
jgi:hypothetical protein